MHRQFITYQGRPLVVGEEDDILTIPEPGIEVNEILGSAEVTEKIAEDVQVGDFIFKEGASFDDYGPTQPGPAIFVNFVVKDGELYLYSNIGSGKYVIHKYVDGRWIDHLGYGRLDHLEMYPQTDVGTQSKLTVKEVSGTVHMTAFTGGNQEYPNLFSIRKVSGGYIKGIAHPPQNILPPQKKESNGRYTQIKAFKFEEHDNEVHAVVTFDNSDLSADNNFYSYKVDLENETWELTTADPSGPIQLGDGIGLKSYNNELYLILGLYGGGERRTPSDPYLRLIVYKWNSSSQNWDWHQDIETSNGQDYGRYVEFYEGYGGLWLATSHYQGPNVFKLNESTGYFDLVDNAIGFPDASSAGANSPTLYEDGDDFYLACGAANVNPTNDIGFNIHKYDPSTSSFNLYQRVGGVPVYRTTGSDSIRNLDIKKYGEELFAALSTGRETLVFKYNYSTSSWDRDTDFLPRNYRSADGSILTFKGNDYLGIASPSETLCVFLLTSGTDGKPILDRTKLVDVTSPNGAIECNLYEHDNKMYAFVRRWPGYLPAFWVYEYDEAQNQFFKLADTSATTYNTSLSRSTSLSGVQYVTLAGPNGNQVNIYSGVGGIYERMPDPSSTLQGPCRGADIIAFSGQLFAANNTYINLTTIPGMMESWKWNGSSWDTISFNVPFDPTYRLYYPVGCAMWIYNDELYMHMGAQPVNDPTYESMTFKYDSSANEWVYQDELRSPRVGSTSHQQLYAVTHNGKPWLFSIYRTSENYRTVRVAEQLSEGVWRHHPFPNSDDVIGFEGLCPVSWNNKLWVFYDHFAYSDSSLRVAKLSDYVGEEVWMKNRQGYAHEKRYIDFGIALESGSKGDTIRIQKVRR